MGEVEDEIREDVAVMWTLFLKLKQQLAIRRLQR